MEIHHRPHGEKKGFREYVPEGLMIFIAVSPGFVAESIREKETDNHKEMEYVGSYISDLQQDSASLQDALKANNFVLSVLD